MAVKELFFTVMIAWTPTGVSTDSVGVKTFFNKTEYTKCELIKNMIVEDAQASIKRSYRYSKCTSELKKLDEMECLFEAHDFKKKHNLKEVKCRSMSVEKYNKHYTGQKAEFWKGPEWPIIYVCPIGKRSKCKCLLADKSCLTED